MRVFNIFLILVINIFTSFIREHVFVVYNIILSMYFQLIHRVVCYLRSLWQCDFRFDLFFSFSFSFSFPVIFSF